MSEKNLKYKLNTPKATVKQEAPKLQDGSLAFIQVGDRCLHWYRNCWVVVGLGVPLDAGAYDGGDLDEAVEVLYCGHDLPEGL